MGLLDGLASLEVRTTTESGVNVQATSGTFVRIAETKGPIFSVVAGSPGAFGAIIQTGSFATGAGSTGAASFRQNFATANTYIVWAWPQSGNTIIANGSVNAYTSGTANNGKNTSGANFVGGASITYDYIAIGV